MTSVVTAARQEPVGVHGPGSRSSKWLAIGLFILGVGAAAVSLLGPLVFDVIRYHVSAGATNQVVGGDVAGLLLMAPVSGIAGILVWRRHRAGSVLALGPAAYALYMYSQLALGNDVDRYPGNSEQFFPLFLGLLVLSGAIAIGAWSVTSRSDLPVPPSSVRRIFGWFAVIVAAFLVLGLHLPTLLDVSAGQPGPEYVSDPVVFWLVKLMDLGLVTPALLAVGFGLVARKGWAIKPMYAAAGWIALLGSSVAGMALMMQLTSDPAATVANSVAFGLFAVIGLAVALAVYRPLFGRN